MTRRGLGRRRAAYLTNSPPECALLACALRGWSGLVARWHPPRPVSPVKRRFIAGPIPVSWVCQASKLGVKTLLVGLALWHTKGLRKNNTFIVSNLVCGTGTLG